MRPIRMRSGERGTRAGDEVKPCDPETYIIWRFLMLVSCGRFEVMAQQDLEDFGGYRKAQELFELVADDMEALENRPICWRLVGQQIASADSIAANIEEGWGRGSRKEYVQFLMYARGSARETRGRYERMRRWLIGIDIETRTSLCDEIIGIVTATITRLRSMDS
jgi:four helix bundle protein